MAFPSSALAPATPASSPSPAKELVETADLVVHAGSLVSSELLDAYCDDAEQVNSVRKDLEELVPLMRDAYEDGRDVVRLHSGDPPSTVPP